MATRAVGPGHGWRWLAQAVNLGSQNPKALLGAAAILVAIAMVPTALQLLAESAVGAGSMTLMALSAALSLLFGLLVMPPLSAGFLRVIHASESGAPTRATAILDGYRQHPGRVILLTLALILIAVAVLAAVVLLFGASMLEGLGEFIAAAESMQDGQAAAMPALPAGFGILVAALVVFGLFYNGVYAISFGQVALGGRGIGEALRDGFAGALKNLLPLLVLMVIALVVAVVLGLVLALVMAVLGALGALVSPVLGVLLIAPFYFVAMLALYVVMFGVMYFMWRDICTDGASLPAERDDQVEV